MAQPLGGQMQFRYDQQWMSDELWGRIDREGLAGEWGLVCFLYQSPPNAPNKVTPVIVPLRYVRIIRAEKIGSSCIIVFEVGQFAACLSDSDVRSKTVSGDQSSLPGVASKNGTKYAFQAELSQPRTSKDLNLRAFETIAARLSQYAPFNSDETVYYTLFRVAKKPAMSWFGTWPRPEKIARASFGAYELSSGCDYEFEVYALRHFSSSSSIPVTDIALQVLPFGDDLRFISSTENTIDSRYDVKRFVCSSDHSLLQRVSRCNIVLSGPAGVRPREITIPVVLQRNVLLGGAKWVLLTVGTAIAAITALIASEKYSTGAGLLILAGAAVAAVAALFPSIKKY
uniref:hypothetical protein n=1 Tax=Parerythrobacter lutipelagi TaxID=1964208 RepID=UPI00195DC281|nr:hypothetical protein [Parerythrobacter lutipelagi]